MQSAAQREASYQAKGQPALIGETNQIAHSQEEQKFSENGDVQVLRIEADIGPAQQELQPVPPQLLPQTDYKEKEVDLPDKAQEPERNVEKKLSIRKGLNPAIDALRKNLPID